MENSKEQLREIHKIKRRNIENKKEKDKAIFSKVIRHSKVIKADTILLYYAKEEEVETLPFIDYFLSIGKVVGLPKTQEQKITFYLLKNKEDVKLGKYNIFEPISNQEITDYSNSICIVPGICFDKNNFRIGYGGGYYDKFLSTYDGYKIGIIYQECIVDNIKIDKYDKQVDIVITD